MLKDYITLLQSLIAVPSISREETEAADLLEGWMKEHGLEVHRKANNLWCENRPAQAGDHTILLNAHIDTVRPSASYTRDPFTPAIEDDTLYGLGSNDDGGSLVALLAAFMEIVGEDADGGSGLYSGPGSYSGSGLYSSSRSPRIIFSATAEEEVSGKNGIELILSDLGPIDLGIMGEPTGMQMAIAERGLMVLDCMAHGKSGHAARNEGINAIYKALPDIDWFRNYQFPKVSPTLGPVKMTVTGIHAGTQHNVVPDTCTFMVDIRSNDCYRNIELLELIKQQVSCDVKERSTRLNSSGISLEHPFVKAGLAMGLTTFGSPTASNQTLVDFTTIKIGPGDSARSHTADEYIKISEIEQGIKIYYDLISTYVRQITQNS